MTIDLRLGHTLERLREIPDESVQCIVTSPPYWGLRAYGTEPQVWLNGHEPCAVHQWKTGITKAAHRNGIGSNTYHGDTDDPYVIGTNKPMQLGNTCSACGAWRGELGLEPTPELYVEHLTQIFREARRVLRDDGTLWLNLGDSYAGSGGYCDTAPSNATSRAGQRGRQGALIKGNHFQGNGLKPKDLIGIPWRVAFALQADGWYLRQDIIWSKPNPMPESVRDRCTKAHEYVFLMSKSPRYYYDADAIKEPVAEYEAKRIVKEKANQHHPVFEIKHEIAVGRHGTTSQFTKGHAARDESGRNRRSVWTVTTHPFKEAHFATFPPKLIEPMILAGCPVGGTVLDPFNGSGTTGLAALQLGRNYIGIELKPEYIEMTKRRLENVQTKEAL